jgi:putative hydrolase of the HAD superfamily
MALGVLKPLPLKSPRAILLDGLGTLVALQPPWEAFARALLREHRIELSPGEAEWAFAAEMRYYRAHHLEGRDAAGLKRLRRRCAEVLYAALPPPAAHALSLDELTAAMLGALRFTLYPEVLASLALLRARGLRLVVVSNWDVSLAPTLEALGIAGLLDAVITSAGVGAAKPAPQVFHAALALLDIPAHEALHVGDDPSLDVAGALAAGVQPVLLCREPRAGAAGVWGAPGVRGVRETLGGRGGRGTPAGVTTILSLADLPRLLS